MLTMSELLEPLARRRTDEVVVTTMSTVRPWGRLSSHDLDFASIEHLLASLLEAPSHGRLTRTLTTPDLAALDALARDESIVAMKPRGEDVAFDAIAGYVAAGVKPVDSLGRAVAAVGGWWIRRDRGWTICRSANRSRRPRRRKTSRPTTWKAPSVSRRRP